MDKFKNLRIVCYLLMAGSFFLCHQYKKLHAIGHYKIRTAEVALIKKNVQEPRETDGWSFRGCLLRNDVNLMKEAI